MSNYVEAVTLFPTRATELPFIVKNRRQFFKNLIGDNEVSTWKESEITSRELIFLMTAYLVNLNYITHLLDLAIVYGAIYVVVSYVLLQTTLSTPFLMLYMFLSSYSKRSYINFWACAPIFEGLGYTIGILRFVIEILNVASASWSILLIADLLDFNNRALIQKCKYNDFKEFCATEALVRWKTVQCPVTPSMRGKNQTIYIPLQHHLRYRIWGYDQFNTKCCTINTKLLIVTIGLWILIFMVSLLGLTKIKKITINILIVVGVALCAVCLYSVPFLKVHDDTIPFCGFSVQGIAKFHLWVGMTLHAGEATILASVMWLGTLKQASFLPTHVALVMSTIKMTLYLFILCYSSRALHDIVKYYKFIDAQCLVIYGHDLIFALIPDVLIRVRFGAMATIIWYLGIFYIAIITPIYTMIGFVNALTERSVTLKKYRLFVFLSLCIVGLILNIFLCLNINFAILHTFRYRGLPLITTTMLFVLVLALMFVYSTNRIIDDYSFTFGSAPQGYWILFWKSAPLFVLITFIFMLYRLKAGMTGIYNNVYFTVSSYVQSACILLPILLVAVVKCCMHIKYRTLASLSKPTAKWGPHNQTKHQARKYFYPQRDVKYRNTTLKCVHKCLVNGAQYNEEKRIQNSKLNNMIFHLEKKNDFSYSDMVKTNK